MRIFKTLRVFQADLRAAKTFAPFRSYHFDKKRRKLLDYELLADMAEGNQKQQGILPSGASSHVSLNILQNGSYGFHRCVYLASNHAVYLFNCPDGNRRLFSEHGLRRIPWIRNVFFTYGGWNNVSGLASLAACLNASNVKSLDMHGPIGLMRIINVARTFADHAKMQRIDKPSMQEQGVQGYEDETVAIECVPLTKSPETEAAFQEYLEKIKTKKIQPPSPLRADDLAVAYICKLKPKWGKIQLDKCLALGIQIGPAIGLLQRGLATTNRDGQEVLPEQVREPPLPPDYLAVVECPNNDFLDALIRSVKFAKFQTNGEEQLRLIVHFSPSHVLNTDEYRQWMHRFPTSTIHWICNDEAPPICHLGGVYRQQARLHQVHNEIFPLLWHHKKSPMEFASEPSTSDAQNSANGDDVIQKSTNSEGAAEKSINAALSTSGNVIFAEPFTKYSFRPPNGFQQVKHNEFVLYPEEREALAEDLGPSISEPSTMRLDQFRKEVAQMKLSGEIYPITTFFGTGASTPTKYRNVSAIQLELGPGAAIMFDCGESTVSQMQLFYGKEAIDQRLCDLKAVLISHLHLDHHFGLYSLILDRKAAFERSARPYENLVVVAATPLSRAHREFSTIVEDITGFCDFYSTAPGDQLVPSMRKACEQLGLRRLEPVKVFHPQCATGFVVITGDGKKVVYSGDTKPCDQLVQRGMDADLLIHEATLNDGWEEDALYKKHCTKSQAIAVSRAMRAKRTILTHFTGLNTKLPYMEKKILEENPTVGMSTDFMTARWEQLELLPKIVPVIFEMQSEHMGYQEMMAAKKRLTPMLEEEDQSVGKMARVE